MGGISLVLAAEGSCPACIPLRGSWCAWGGDKRATVPARPDVAQTLWKRETLSAFWLGAGFKKAEFALLWPERMCQHSKSPGRRISGSGRDRLMVQKRGSRKRVSLLTRCAFSARPGEETPANSTEPGKLLSPPCLANARRDETQGMAAGALQRQGCAGKPAAPNITQSVLSRAHVPLPHDELRKKLRAG